MRCILCIQIASLLLLSAHAYADVVIDLDSNGPGRVFDGIGGLSAGANSRLLMDYPEPQRSQILDFLFKPNFGASLQVLKVEIGGTVNSTWGSEPSHANTRDEFEHPKPEYYDRGYEWWLMKEARKRNPDIIIESLQWGAPGWIGKGEFFSQDNADFVAQFIKGARDYYGVTINYQGIRNEAGFAVDYIRTLRRTLDENGLQHVKLVATDSVADHAWDIVPKMASDPELSNAIYAVGAHYVSYTSTDAAKSAGKPLWCSEESQSGESPWVRAEGYAKLYNRNYVLGRMTKTIICSLITSNFEYLAPFNVSLWANPGLMKANTPWSGHYDVIPPIWTTAHTTQFARPGWKYLDGGCGLLEKTGSYVTLRSPDESGDYSIIVETMQGGYENIVSRKDGDPLPDIPARPARFNVKNLSTGTIHVWRSNRDEQFARMPDITPENGSFEITLEGNSIYTLTTTTGQRKGAYDIPKEASFPFPYEDDFEGYAPGRTARYFSDEQGTFAVAERPDGRGKCLRQIVPQRGIEWFSSQACPWTIIGDAAWKDYEVSVDVLVGEKGSATLYGRIDDALSRAMPGGYGLTIDNTGAWQLKDTTTLIESGNVRPIPWHNLKLRFKGSHVIAVIDGVAVCSIMDDFHHNGAVGLACSFEPVEFDNFIVRPFKGRTPDPIARWENLALGKKAIASKQLNGDYGAEKATDGNHSSGWCPDAGKVAGEWLEVDLGGEMTFDRTIIDQHKPGQYAGGITAYKIQYWNGRDWKNLVIGKSMAVRQMDDFSPVTARKVRLLVTSCGENSCVYEFQVFRHKR